MYTSFQEAVLLLSHTRIEQHSVCQYINTQGGTPVVHTAVHGKIFEIHPRFGDERKKVSRLSTVYFLSLFRRWDTARVFTFYVSCEFD